MKNNTTLSFRPNTLPHESAGSALLRLSEVHTETPVTLLRVLGKQTNNLSAFIRSLTVGNTETVAPFMDTHRWQLPELYQSLADSRQWAQWLDFKHARLCPKCAEKGALPYWHDVTGVEACPEHHCHLIEKCPHCATEITWSRLGVNLCNCYGILSEKSETVASEQVINAAKRLKEWIEEGEREKVVSFHEFRRIFSERYLLWPAACQPVLEFLDGDVKPISMLLASMRKYPSSIAARSVVAPLLSVSSDQYKALLHAVAQEVASASASSPTSLPDNFMLSRQQLAFTLGCTLKVVDEIFKGRLAAFTSKESRTRKTLNLNGVIKVLDTLCRQNGSTSGASIRTLVTTHRLSSSVWLDKLLNGDIDVTLQGESLLDTIVDADVKTDVTLPEGHFTLEQAATYLDLYPEAVRSLLKVKLLNSTEQRNRNNRYLLPKSSLDYFISHYAIGAQLAARLGTDPKSYAERLIHLGIKPVSGRTVDGNIVYVFKKADADSLEVSKAALQLNRFSRSGRQTKSTHEPNKSIWADSKTAAALLGFNTRHLSKLVDVTPLTAGYPNSSDPFKLYYRKTTIVDAQRFLESLVSVDTLAVATELSRPQLVRRIGYIMKNGIIRIRDVDYLSAEHAELVKQHCKLYWCASATAKYLGCKRCDIHNWKRLGHLIALPSQHPDYIEQPSLFEAKVIRKFRRPQ